MGKHVKLLEQLLEYWWNKQHNTQWDNIQEPKNQVVIHAFIYYYLKDD